MTRAEVEKTILARLKVIMLAAGLSNVTDGTNADLRDPIQTGLLQMQYASAFDPTETNLALVPDAYLLEFLLRAEIRALKNIMGNIQGTDISMTTGKSENRSQLISQIETMLRELRTDLAIAIEGTAAVSGGTILVGGRLALDFQDQYEFP